MQAGLDIAQALAIGQLREGHRQQLVPTGKSPEVRVAMVAGNTLLKFLFGQMLDQLREDGAARVHPSLVSPRRQAEGSQSGPFSIQIVPAPTIRHRACLQWVRVASRNFSRTAVIGCDFHPSWQQIAWLDTETGETGEQKLVHASGDAKSFYAQLPQPMLIGMEATGNSQWFIELVQDLGHEIWVGDAAQIRASYVRKQKTDKRDAAHILKLVVEGRFPRLWTPDREQRDLRQLVLHRHKLVEIRSRVKNELQHLSLNKGMQRKAKLWSQAGQKLFRELPLKPWAACRREDLLGLLTILNQQIGKLDEAVQQAADEHPQARLLMTQPGVGPNTALAYVL